MNGAAIKLAGVTVAKDGLFLAMSAKIHLVMVEVVENAILISKPLIKRNLKPNKFTIIFIGNTYG